MQAFHENDSKVGRCTAPLVRAWERCPVNAGVIDQEDLLLGGLDWHGNDGTLVAHVVLPGSHFRPRTASRASA